MATPQRSLNKIKAPIAAELEHFELHFRNAVQTRVMLLNRVMQYIIKRKGKQMRPMFVLLSAKLSGDITPASYRGAALIELLHTATLVHDDVVDDSDERRGFFSLSALWKNKIAVLVGDYLLSRGLLMSLEYDDFQLLKITSKAVKLMSEGELLQMEKARTLNIDEPVYFEIIRQKTASLIASCTEVGAASASSDPEHIEKMRQIGEAIGMAFQIKDDLLDYGQGDIGKPKGIDLKEKKMTLPLIHSLNQASWAERRKLINIVRNHNTDPAKVKYLLDFVHAHNGITYSQQTMDRYTQEAMTLLRTLPDSPTRQSFEDLVYYTIERDS
jgi:octaprenyl-diphosphate synthase